VSELPPCVARYLERAGDAGPGGVSLAQAGRLRAAATSRRWMPFEAVHEARADRPEFTWQARVRLAPFVSIRVRDSLRDGVGSGEVRFWGVRLGHDAGTPQMHSGALHRYLAEAVWVPGALRPSERLRWSALDDERRAIATLADAGCEVSLEFRFDPAGDVESIYTAARWGKFGQGYRQVPWEGHFRDYFLQDGLRVPAAGEVGWYAGQELQLVWQGRLTRLARRGCAGGHRVGLHTGRAG
jgi:hypothetical protein